MALSPDLLEILRCPDDRSRLALADDALVERLNEAIAAGKVRNKGGEPVREPVDAGLVREDGAILYPVREDIPVLCAAFLDRFARNHAGRHPRISPRSMERLRTWHWPGNASELERVLLRAALLARGGTIYPKQLGLGKEDIDTESIRQDFPSLAEIEQAHILRVLEAMEGNKSLAAKVLGISTSTLYDKLKKFDA